MFMLRERIPVGEAEVQIRRVYSFFGREFGYLFSLWGSFRTSLFQVLMASIVHFDDIRDDIRKHEIFLLLTTFKMKTH